MSNRLQMGEEGIPWVNQSITAAARVIGVMFPKLNLKNEETLHDWLSRYKTEIETAFKYVRKVPITNLNSAGITAALVTAAINGVPEIYIKGFMEALPNPQQMFMQSICVMNCKNTRRDRRRVAVFNDMRTHERAIASTSIICRLQVSALQNVL